MPKDQAEASSQLVVEILKSIEAFRGLEAEWRALEQHSGYPFASFDWALSWWLELREDKLGVKDALSLRTIRTRQGQLVAVAPMLVSRRPSVGPICVRQLQFFGADPNITELRGLVALPGWYSAAYRALVEHALAHTDDWDSMLLSGITSDVDLGAVQSSSDFQWLYQLTDHELQLPSSWEAFRGKLPRNIKESLRKCYNSLKRDQLAFRLEVVETPQQVGPALGRFFELHAARASVADTVHHWDVFRAPEAQRFLIDVCKRFAERGCLRIFQLVVDGEVVAVRIGLIAGGTLYLYYSGYDPAFAKYSVMTTTVAEAIRYAIEHGFSRVNLSTGSDVSKTRWNPTSRETRAAMLHSPSVRSRLTHRVYQHALSAIGTSSALRRATTFLARRSIPSAAI